MLLLPAFILMTGLAACVASIGRALVAQVVGVPLAQCDLGIGPVVARMDGSSTRFIFRLLPIWARSWPEAQPRRSSRWCAYERASFARRLLVDISRPAVSITLAVLMMWTYFAAINLPFDAVEITQVTSKSPAAAAGLRTGDVIVASKSFEFNGARRFVAALQTSKGKPIHLQVIRQNQTTTVAVIPKRQQARLFIGITYKMRPGAPQPMGAIGAIEPAFAFIKDAAHTIIMLPVLAWRPLSANTTLLTEVIVAFVPSGYLGIVAWVLGALSAVLVALASLIPLPTMKSDGYRIILNFLSRVTGWPLERLQR
ncbi:MAG: M50 family metallopeptidase [Myxococcota bacterium]